MVPRPGSRASVPPHLRVALEWMVDSQHQWLSQGLRPGLAAQAAVEALTGPAP